MANKKSGNRPLKYRDSRPGDKRKTSQNAKNLGDYAKAGTPNAFKKGNKFCDRSLYPGDAEMRLIKKLTKQELIDVGSIIVRGNIEGLKNLNKSPKATVLSAMLAAVCDRVIKLGDMQAFDILLNRLIGKVKDEVHHSGDVNAQVVVSLPPNGREVA